MNIQELMNRIKMDNAAQEYVLEHLLEEKEYQELKELFLQNDKAFFEKWKMMENYRQ